MKLNYNIANHNQDIFITNNKIELLSELILKKINPDKIFIITDNNLYKMYFITLMNIFQKHFQGKQYYIILPAGESSKNQFLRNEIETSIISENPTKKSLILAFGGGVVGDFSGLIAATVLRGISFVQVPTSIVAQIDSSLGGKNGIDVSGIKNIIGTIYQPDFIFIDSMFLRTLPKVEFINGLFEVIKTFAIYDKQAFAYLEKNLNKLLDLDEYIINKIIEKCVKIKMDVVCKDTSEKGLRKILNYGHTAGHALESVYAFRIKHGFAVAEGMIVESKLAYNLGLLSKKDMDRIINLIEKVRAIYPGKLRYTLLQLYEFMIYDKKKTDHKINFSLVNKLGSCLFDVKLEKNEFLEAMDK